MRNYLCQKCGTQIKSNSTPSGSGCPSGSAGTMHNWTNLGEVGDRNYQCKKCGSVVQSKSAPSSMGCPSGRPGTSHSWNKL